MRLAHRRSIRRRDNTLRHSDRWGFDRFRELSRFRQEPPHACLPDLRLQQPLIDRAQAGSAARPACRAGRQDRAVRRLRDAGAVHGRRAEGAPPHPLRRRPVRRVTYGPDRAAREIRQGRGRRARARGPRAAGYSLHRGGPPALRVDVVLRRRGRREEGDGEEGEGARHRPRRRRASATRSIAQPSAPPDAPVRHVQAPP